MKLLRFLPGLLLVGTQAFASHTSSGSFVLTAVVPEIMHASAVSASAELQSLALEQPADQVVGSLQFESNTAIAGIYISSNTRSGAPERKGIPLTAGGGEFALALRSCRTLPDRVLSLKGKPQPLAGSASFHGALNENCNLALAWKPAAGEAAIPRGKYSMNVVIDMVAN